MLLLWRVIYSCIYILYCNYSLYTTIKIVSSIYIFAIVFKMLAAHISRSAVCKPAEFWLNFG
jgi:hypothetical protein